MLKRLDIQDSLNKIHKVDCLEGMRHLPSDSVDVCIADPPYNIGKDFGEGGGDNLDISTYSDWCEAWIKESLRIVKANGVVYVYGFPEILAYISVRFPMEQQRWLVWHYTNKTIPTSKFWQRSFEMLLCLWKGDKPKLNIDAIREPYTETFLRGAAGKVRNSKNCRFSKGESTTVYAAHEKGALPRDVIKIPALAGGAGYRERWFYCKTCDSVPHPTEFDKHREHEVLKHPTQKPYELSQRLLLSSAEKGKIALIPFVGSGTECVVARDLGIGYVGFEINEDYIKLATQRIDYKFKQGEML